jgi:CubicO group peptidase (beta-lactamase class C family)
MQKLTALPFLLSLMLSAQALAVEPEFAEDADTLLRSLYTDTTPGATVVVSEGGEIVLHAAYGMADLELGVPMQTDHILRLASVTKQYAAAAIMALVEDGELALDDPLSKFLPDFPVGDVTVHQLLNHTSGIKSYTSIEGYMTSERIRKDLSTAELIAVFADEPVDFAPGEQWSYNNSGYVLLGAIIEAVSGQSWNDYIRERLLEPAGIETTDYYPDETIVEGRVPGYSGPADAPYNAAYLSMTQPHAAGALSSTALDVDRWQQALHGGELLEPDSYDRMLEADDAAGDALYGHAYGYGLIVGEWMGRPVIHHGGGINGFTTYAFWLPESELSIVVLTNRAGPGVLTQDTALRLAGLAMGESYPIERSRLDHSPEALMAFQGTYRIDEETTRTLRVEDGRLISQRQGGRSFDVYPAEGGVLVFDESLSWFEIERNEAGDVTAVLLHQGWGGEPERAARISDEVASRQPVELEDAQLQRLVGRYQLFEGFVLTVRVADGGLEMQGTGQPATVIHAESESEFYNDEIGAEIVFDLPDDGGPAGSLTLFQGGGEYPAPRIED